MAQGEVYAEVDASVVNGGIAPMAIISSGPKPEVDEDIGQVTFWIKWWYDEMTGEGGFTGKEWYTSDENNPLHEFGSDDAFKQVLLNENPQNLDAYLGNWPSDKKQQFVLGHADLYETCIV